MLKNGRVFLHVCHSADLSWPQFEALLAEYEVRVKAVYQEHNPDALSESGMHSAHVLRRFTRPERGIHRSGG